jgi:AcrR family transcriptional regulator
VVKGKRGVRAGLDRSAVIEAAAKLADESGGEVTFAALASHLGVQPPSLYNHVAGQDGLRRELALLGLRELERRVTRATVGRSGADAILSLAQAYRGFARQRPGVYAATLRAPDPGDAELTALANDIVAVLVAVMESCGLRGDDAIHAIRSLRALLHGFVTLEAAGGFGLPVDLDESFRRAVQAFVAGM